MSTPATDSAPEGSADNLKLLVVGIILLGSCVILVGVLPTVILIAGWVLTLRGGSVQNIKTTTRFVQGVAIIGILFCCGVAVYHSVKAAGLYEEANYDPETDPRYDDVMKMSIMQKVNCRNPLLINDTQPIQDQPVCELYAEFSQKAETYWDAKYKYGTIKDIVTGNIVVAIVAVIVILVLEFLWMRPLMRKMISRASIQSAETKNDTPRASIIKRDSLASYSVADELRKWRGLREDGTVTEEEYQAARSRIINT